ncbi:MerR family transcriptional regulator, partial [Bacillus pseudomycoides]
IKQVLLMKENQSEVIQVREEVKEISKSELRKILRDELQHTGRFNRTSLRQGDISRFFH